MAFAHTEYERTMTRMDDYIKREALRDALYDADAITMNGVKIFNQFSSSDVEPVKHGRWKRCGKNLGECSECGEVVAIKSNYCPNCGADMRENTNA